MHFWNQKDISTFTNLAIVNWSIKLVVKKKVISILNSTNTGEQYYWISTYTVILCGNINTHKIECTIKQKCLNLGAESIIMPTQFSRRLVMTSENSEHLWAYLKKNEKKKKILI